MSNEQMPPKDDRVFVVDESIKSNVQPIKQERRTDRPKPVTPPPKKK